MTTSNPSEGQSANETGQNIIGIALRVFWMLLGIFALAITGLSILKLAEPGFSWVDIIYWGITALLIGARYVDVAFCRGLTVKGLRATRADWVRYAIILFAVASAAWLAAHVIAYALAK